MGKHPVEIGHDEIEVRFAPMSRTEGVLIADAAGRARTRRRRATLQVTEDGFARLPKSAMIGPLLSDSSPTQTKFAASVVAPDPRYCARCG